MEAAIKIPEELGRFRERRPSDYGLENALARKIRREYPSKPVEAFASDYGLTLGEAKGALYGTASRATINKIIKSGGWALTIELIADVIGQPLEHFIEEQAAKARHERIEWEARERAHQTRLQTLADLGFTDRLGSQPPR